MVYFNEGELEFVSLKKRMRENIYEDKNLLPAGTSFHHLARIVVVSEDYRVFHKKLL